MLKKTAREMSIGIDRLKTTGMSALAAAGGRLVVSDIDDSKGEETVRLITEAGGEAFFVSCDVSDEKQVADLVAAVVDVYGRIDWAHNNAGFGTAPGPVTEMRRDPWDHCLAITLTGTMLCLKHELSRMRAQGLGGSVVNTASVSGLVGQANQSAYVSGFFGGMIDTVIQRIIEILRSIPTIPLWMGLAAALPAEWSVVQVYFAITIIISLIGWTELARVVRGRFISLKEEDFVMAAELVGCSKSRIIFRHMVPSFISHIIAATTLAIPAIIISETSLSFLGLGLRPPAISWGVLLQDAQNIQALVISPWLLVPTIPVVVAVLAFNFMGDGIRDAADPYL